jgi:hypothetical protein
LYSPLWALSHSLAVVTGCVFLAALIVFAAGRSWLLRVGIDAILPDRWFHSLADSQMPEGVQRLRKEAARELRKPQGPKRPDSFGLGSTKGEVLAVQGKPDEAGNDTWHYGGSEVYFLNDRVVGWRGADRAPLKAR